MIAAVAACGTALALGGPALAERIQLGKIILDVDGGFSPTKLPKKELAPITLQAEGDVSTTDGTLPPPAKTVIVDWDRNGKLTTKGLPVCRPERIENTTTPAAMDACEDALVGKGFASGMVQFPDDPPFAASSTVLAFNGPKQGGNPTIILHAYAFVPAPTTFVVPVVITKIKGGRYGYRSTVEAPVIAGGYGVITHFDIKVGRRYKSKGQRLSYLAARCADGRLQAQGSVTFVDGSSLLGHVLRRCSVRK